MSGVGLGRVFVSRHVYFVILTEILGEEPYPGTLNIDVGMSTRDVELLCEPHHVKSIIHSGSVLGGFKYWLGTVGADSGSPVDVLVLRPDLSRHGPRVLELVSSKYLRGALGLKDGDYVCVDLRCQ